ncbi:lipid II flippase MurJ [Sphingomonas baiyangensis]|nr:lipid II flippase MurJ [Sphingomonas baiyangensis]
MTDRAIAAAPRGRSIRALARSTGLVMLIRAADFGLSFLVSVLLANRFGASGQLDAFFLARRTTVGFADTIRKLVGQVVLPPVVAAMDRGEPPSIHSVPRKVWWFVGGLMLLTLTGTVLPSALVYAFAPGFSDARHDMTATMMAIMMPLLPIAVLASLLAAVLQARRRYLLSEGTNLVQRAILVGVLAFLVPPLGIVAGAWTMLGAGAVGFVILLAGAWGIIRHPPRVEREAAPVAPTAETKGGGLLAAILLNVYFQATALMDFAFASMAEDGGVAALEYGSRLVSLVPGLVMTSLYTVTTPELIRAVQQPDPGAAARGIMRFQRIALFAQLPVSVGMMLGSVLMVSAIFGHGAFTREAVLMAAATTAGYAAAAVFLAPLSAITSAIYADPRGSCVRDLAIIAVGGVLLRLAALALGTPQWGVEGIAWGAAIATALTALLAQWVANRRFHHFDHAEQSRDFALSFLCAALAAGAGYALLVALPDPSRVIGELAQLIALGALVLLVYFAAALVLRVPEMAIVRDIARQRIARRRRG